MRKFYLLAAIVMLVLVIAVVGLAIVAKSTDLATESVVSATQESESDLAFLIFRSSSDCTAPCWLGIRPGVTTEDDLEDLVAANRGRFEGFECGPVSGCMNICNWRDPLLEVNIQLATINNIVDTIAFLSGATLMSERQIIGYQSSISSSDVIDVLGSPSRYYATVEPTSREGGVALELTFFYEEGVVTASRRAVTSDAPATSQPGHSDGVGHDMPVTDIFFYHAESGLSDAIWSHTYEMSLPWLGWDSVSVESRF